MPTFKKHFRNCRSFDVPEEICGEVNKEMDKPSQRVPGCRHREFRHQVGDCNQIGQMLAREAKNEIEASKIVNQAFLACKIHIRDDCREGEEICKRSLPCREIEKDPEISS